MVCSMRMMTMTALVLIAVSGYSQSSQGVLTDEIRHAVRVLKNIDVDRSKAWAIALLTEAAENDTSAYAMNTLGLAYLSGSGVEKDTPTGMSWLKKAGEHGFADAWHNLGMIYKDGTNGVAQNFGMAYKAFVRGADEGSMVCQYDAGFMLYKGLGCQQDYAKAASLFEQASAASHSPSLYMLGLCYRNGYGVEQDTARASQLLHRSAILSFRPAMEELRRPEPENYLRETAADTSDEKPQHMPSITPATNDTSLIYGHHTGYVVMYDWSGQYILGEKPVVMTISHGNGLAEGNMILSDDTIAFKAQVMADGRLIFTDGILQLNERYTPGRKVNYRMDHAMLDIWEGKIRGSLSLYSLKLKEPERPMYMELVNTMGSETSSSDRYGRITAMPNPFSQSFIATFELLEPCHAQVRLFDQAGRMVYRHDLGHMAAGRQSVRVTPNVKDGTYVLNVKAGKQVLRAIIVKKGGAE